MTRMPKQYSVLKGYFVALGSLLAGASLVHSIFKPDLHIPIEANSCRGEKAPALEAMSHESKGGKKQVHDDA